MRGESIESHALHLFFLAVPDYLDRPSAIAVAAEHPAAVMLGLRLKRLGNLIQETIGGRAIHPVNAVPGGFGRVPSADQLIAIRGALIEAIPDAEAMLDLIASLPDAGFCHTPTAYAALHSPDSDRYYAGDQLMIVSNGDRATIPAADYRSLTNEKPVAHSHAKHSSFHGKPFMVGSLARLTVNPGRRGTFRHGLRAAQALHPVRQSHGQQQGAGRGVGQRPGAGPRHGRTADP